MAEATAKAFSCHCYYAIRSDACPFHGDTEHTQEAIDWLGWELWSNIRSSWVRPADRMDSERA